MSNQAVKGVCDRVYTKTKSTRFGDKNLHYVVVGDITFSTGFKSVFSEGEYVDAAVKFNYGELQYQQGVSTDGLSPAIAGGAKPATKGNFGGAKMSNTRGTFPIDPKDGQMSIIRQSSINRAVEIVNGLIDADLFHPKKEEQYLNKVLEIALIVTDFSSGNDIMQLAAAKAAAKEAVNG